MAQVQFAAESLEVNLIADAADLIFLDDATCEFVGGGDAVNGY